MATDVPIRVLWRCCWLAAWLAALRRSTHWCWGPEWQKGWLRVLFNQSLPSSSCAPSRRMNKDGPVASLVWGWCWHRPSDPALAGSWSTCSGGAPSSSWWFRFAWPLCGWPIASCRPPHPVAWRPTAVERDWRGLLLGSVGTLCLLNGLVDLRGGSGLQAVTLLLAALASLFLFIWWERRIAQRGGEALMNLHLFSYRQFAMGSIVAVIYGTALFGSTYLLPVYMQLALHISASHVGTILLPAGFVLAGTIAVVGRMADKQPTYWLVSIGLALLAASFALMVVLTLESALWQLALLAVLGRVGLGFILPSLNLGAMRPLSKALIPQGASSINFLRMLGGAAGVSLCGIVLEWRLAAHGDSLSNPVTSAARVAAFDEVFMLLAALCLLAMAAAWQLREVPDATNNKNPKDH